MKLHPRHHNGGMSRERPTSHLEHADYRAKVIDADRAAERLAVGFHNGEPWAFRFVEYLEKLLGRPLPPCDECGRGWRDHFDGLRAEEG